NCRELPTGRRERDHSGGTAPLHRGRAHREEELLAFGSWPLALGFDYRRVAECKSHRPIAESQQLRYHCQEQERSLDLQRAELTTSAPSAPSLSMNAIWRTIRGYILSQYERGTLHYDITVTLNLLLKVLNETFLLPSPPNRDFRSLPVRHSLRAGPARFQRP